jgi:1-acyl-sn-glycerol-3-phosphate acyltransferase
MMETIYTEIMRQQVWASSRGNVRSLPPEITLIAHDHELAKAISAYLVQSGRLAEPRITTAIGLSSSNVARAAVIVYLPLLRECGMVPDFSEAERVLGDCAAAAVSRFVLVSSAAIYDASFRNPGFVSETYPLPKDRTSAAVASCWRKLEGNARRHFNDGERLTILRCTTFLSNQSGNCIARSFMGRAATAMPGHDPCIQLLHPADLAHAIERVLQTGSAGTFNVAPDGVLPLRQALKQSGTRRIRIPRTILGLFDRIRGKSGASHLNFKRYSWTVSNEKIKAIGFRPRFSSAAALSEFCRQRGRPNSTNNCAELRLFDDFGMDQQYIAFFGRTLFRFLADWYWRIEVAGIENIPQSGRALLAGIHRGFMPWDGVMALDLIVKRTGRYPRFLIHPGLVKFPFLANFMTKLGGIIACQENAKRVLESDELLGVFPEGIQGAFVPYSQAYQIHDFHRDAFVKMALRHRASIVPFVTVGSAEIFPILGKLRSRLWTKYSDWPEFPITPTFPLIPVPLPSKWHTRFLPAMHIQNDYPPSAAADASVVRAISREVRNRMQNAIDEMLRRRRSIFFGSVFPLGTK